VARTRTLLELRTKVRQRADIEGDPHVTDAELTGLINDSCAALHALLIEVDEMWFFNQMSLTTAPGVEALAVYIDSGGGATNFYKLLHVEATIGGIVVPLERWTFERRTYYKNASTWGVAQWPIAYRLSIVSTKAYLYFAPVPDGAYPITVGYVRSFADLVNDADVFDGMDGWEEWVIWDATIKCLVKEESSIVDATRERDVVLVRISSQMATPDRDQPDVTRDVLNQTSVNRYQVRS